MPTQTTVAFSEISNVEYKRRIWAWTMYDWANSAFATTILAAVLPVYYSQVAGATLPSAAIATAYWSAGLSISLFLIAIISPIIGTMSDIMRNKRPLLAVFAGIGIVGTALLVLVETGDWVLASILGIVGRIGFNGANVFYDALLPHVARPEDCDKVSARGYAMGYLGGGLLLAVNVVMIYLLPGTWGARLSFVSVGLWWLVFSIPLFKYVPEPHTASAKLRPGENVLSLSLQRLRRTLKDIRQYRELFKYLIAFLIYVDGIGTIIGVAAIYGAELGFGSVELILAILLVQFVGIPYSLIFGRLPSRNEKRRPLFLAFVLFNMFALPLVGIGGTRLLPLNVIGAPPAPYMMTATAVGQGTYSFSDPNFHLTGTWDTVTVSAEKLGSEQDVIYLATHQVDSQAELRFNGQAVDITYSLNPEGGIWSIWLDGQPVIDEEKNQPLTIDAYNPTVRYGVSQKVEASAAGEHILTLVNSNRKNPASQGTMLSVTDVIVLPPQRQSNLGLILGLILIVQLIGFVLSMLFGNMLFSRLALTIDTQRGIVIALLVYSVVAVWGFFLNSVIEFWFLAWMVAVVQGGSQALSRSLFSSLAPPSKSGEFFGLFGIMEKFSAILGPLLFAYAAATFNNSRPAILSIIAFFIIGGYLLTRVNVKEGQRVAQMEDMAIRKSLSLEGEG